MQQQERRGVSSEEESCDSSSKNEITKSNAKIRKSK
jgi:hypothetical protein